MNNQGFWKLFNSILVCEPLPKVKGHSTSFFLNEKKKLE
jgi:hypothetical protein